nr:unnamed protein product [Callosobruchus analis]
MKHEDSSSRQEAKARILGPTDLHVKAGSSITLTCLISQGPHDLGTVFWYKGDNIIESSAANENDIDINRISIKNHWIDGLTSKLHISDAHLSDSGNYSCVPTIAGATSVNVHVINGKLRDFTLSLTQLSRLDIISDHLCSSFNVPFTLSP